MSGEDLQHQLKAKDEEFRALKISFDDYVESSKELELELEGALQDVSLFHIPNGLLLFC